MSLLPLHSLLAKRSAQGWAHYWQSSAIEFPNFLGFVSELVEGLKDQNPKRIFLYHPSRHLFLAGFLAALELRCPVVLPPNNTKGLLESLMQEGDVLLSDQLDALYGTLIQREVELSKTPSFSVLDPSEATVIFYTSGSTGTPKAVSKLLSQLEREIVSLESAWPSVSEEGAVLSTVTHQHIYGLLFSLLWPVCKGCPIESETFAHWEALFPRLEEGSIVVSSPSHLGRFPIGAGFKQKPQFVFSSAGFLKYEAAEASKAILGTLPWEVYGSTETGGVAFRQQSSMEQLWTSFPEIEIFEGKEGRLMLKSPHLPSDQLYEADDRIKIEEGKGFHLLERLDRTIKVEGKRINLGELEEKIKTHCHVSEVTAVSLNLGNRDEIGVLAVLSPEGLAKLHALGKRIFVQTARESLRSSLESVVIPRKWRFVKALPWSDNGKRKLKGLDSYFTKTLGPIRLPALLREDKEGLAAEIDLKVTSDLAYLEGHFKDTPILPGVVQLHWAFTKAQEMFDVKGRISEVAQLKFNRIISPGAQLKLRLEHIPEKSQITFVYGDEGGSYSSGKLKYSFDEAA